MRAFQFPPRHKCSTPARQGWRISGLLVSLDQVGIRTQSEKTLHVLPAAAHSTKDADVFDLGLKDTATLSDGTMRTVAEGVESAGQLAYLRSHLCDEVQGYYFSVPLIPERIPAFLLGHDATATTASATTDQPRCLLIIDDEPDICELLAASLYGQPYRILTATNSTIAFDALARNNVQVVLCDQRMAGMSGRELLRRVKMLYPDVMRIAMSGSSDRQRITDAVNDGAIFKFLVKPCTAHQIRTVVQSAFDEFEACSVSRAAY